MITKTDLQNRDAAANAGPDPKGSEQLASALAEMKGKGKGLESPEILTRKVTAARAAMPVGGHDLHCGHCWGQGRDAAIAAFETTP